MENAKQNTLFVARVQQRLLSFLPLLPKPKTPKIIKLGAKINLTVTIEELADAHGDDVLDVTARLPRSAAVRIEVRVAQGKGKAEHPAVRVDEIDEFGVGGRQVALHARVHVERIRRVQARYPADLRT